MKLSVSVIIRAALVGFAITFLVRMAGYILSELLSPIDFEAPCCFLGGLLALLPGALYVMMAEDNISLVEGVLGGALTGVITGTINGILMLPLLTSAIGSIGMGAVFGAIGGLILVVARRQG